MKKKIFTDMLLNIFATAIPVAILQLWILPELGGAMEDESYGLMVTIVSFFNVLPGATGNVLNNIRLIHAGDESKSGKVKDFNVLLLIMFLVNVIVTFAISFIYDKEITVFTTILNIVAAVLFLLHGYYSVAFRLKINYVQVIVSNIFLSIGYIVGFFVFCVARHWQFIYVIGYLSSVIYIMFKSELWKEPIKISKKFKRISSDTAWLMFAGILGRVVTYADKMLIFPILGGSVVAIYYAATIFGKLISMVISPISSVMLTYLSKVKKKNNNVFFLSLLSGTCACIVGYVICIFLSEPVISILYPQYVNQAMKYIGITTGIAVVQTLVSMVNPFVIRFIDIKWQVVVSGGNALVYVVLCMGMLNVWGLYGFCVGTLLVWVIKLMVLVIIYLKCNERTELHEQTNDKCI